MSSLLQIACAPFLTGALTVAATAGIADRLEDGPRTASELAASAGLDAAVLLRVLRLLSSVHIFAEREDGRFENNDGSEPLKTKHPNSVRFFCMLAGTTYNRAFAEIMHTARTGEPAFRFLHGESIYGYMDKNPEEGDMYDRAMADLARPAGALLAKQYDFSGIRKVADIGGGNASFLTEILRAWPDIEGICFDRASVCARGERRVAGSAPDGAARRLKFEAGDFFAAAPEGADLYILKNVLHNWNDESSSRILATVRKAMAPDSRLMVIEPLLEKGAASTAKRMDDLFQMVVCEGGVTARSEQQMAGLLEFSGFRIDEIVQLSTGHHVIVSKLR